MKANSNVSSFLLKQKYVGMIFFSDALSLVINHNHKFGLIFVKAKVDNYFARKCVLDSILNNIDAYLLKTVTVSNHELGE